MTKIKKSYRLDSELVEKLQARADKEKKSATETLEDAITLYLNMSDTDSAKSPTGPTNSPTLLETVIDTLKDQLTVKDQQITTLSKELENALGQNREQSATIAQLGENASKALLQSQTLNAADKTPALPVIAGQQAEQPTPDDPPIGEMTFRQLFKTWRKARK